MVISFLKGAQMLTVFPAIVTSRLAQLSRLQRQQYGDSPISIERGLACSSFPRLSLPALQDMLSRQLSRQDSCCIYISARDCRMAWSKAAFDIAPSLFVARYTCTISHCSEFNTVTQLVMPGQHGCSKCHLAICLISFWAAYHSSLLSGKAPAKASSRREDAGRANAA